MSSEVDGCFSSFCKLTTPCIGASLHTNLQLIVKLCLWFDNNQESPIHESCKSRCEVISLTIWGRCLLWANEKGGDIVSPRCFNENWRKRETQSMQKHNRQQCHSKKFKANYSCHLKTFYYHCRRKRSTNTRCCQLPRTSPILYRY